MEKLETLYEETLKEEKLNEFHEIKDEITIYKLAVAYRQKTPVGDDEDRINDENYQQVRQAITDIKIDIAENLGMNEEDFKVKILDVDGYDGVWEDM